MSDELKPALSADVWNMPANEYGARIFELGPNYIVLGGRDGVCVNSDGAVSYPESQPVGAENIAPLIAVLNHALPADSPYKITRADVALLADIADVYAMESGDDWQEDVPKIRALHAKLAALLPPE